MNDLRRHDASRLCAYILISSLFAACGGGNNDANRVTVPSRAQSSIQPFNSATGGAYASSGFANNYNGSGSYGYRANETYSSAGGGVGVGVGTTTTSKSGLWTTLLLVGALGTAAYFLKKSTGNSTASAGVGVNGGFSFDKLFSGLKSKSSNDKQQLNSVPSSAQEKAPATTPMRDESQMIAANSASCTPSSALGFDDRQINSIMRQATKDLRLNPFQKGSAS